MLIVLRWSHCLAKAARSQVSWKLQSIVCATVDVFYLKIKCAMIIHYDLFAKYHHDYSGLQQMPLPTYPHFGGGLWLPVLATRRNPAIILKQKIISQERFLIECRKTKVMTLANQKGHRQSSKPIKTRSKYMLTARSVGKHVWASHDLFCFYFGLIGKVARFF